MSANEKLTLSLVIATLMVAPSALAAGKSSKGKADPADSVSATFTATVAEKSLLQGPGNSTITVPLLPGGKIDPNGVLVKDLGVVSFSTNDPDMPTVTFMVSGSGQLNRVGGGALDYKLLIHSNANCPSNMSEYHLPGAVPDVTLSLGTMAASIHVCAVITGPMNEVILKGDYTGSIAAVAVHP